MSYLKENTFGFIPLRFDSETGVLGWTTWGRSEDGNVGGNKYGLSVEFWGNWVFIALDFSNLTIWPFSPKDLKDIS